MPSTSFISLANSLALSLCLTTGLARAGEIYTQAGLPGLMFGFAQPLNSQFGLRVDVASIGERSDRRTEEGIVYDGKLKLNRAALLADWFPFSGSFRFTGGVTANQYRLDLLATGTGGSITVGSTTYTTTSADQLLVRGRYPSSTPYVGFGWGHQASTGLRFSMDVGAMIGRATVSASPSGPWAQRVSQADIDTELAELRSGMAKVRAVPQLSLGLGYSF